MSMEHPAFAANSEACRRSTAWPCATISTMDPQSDTTKPGNFQASFKMRGTKSGWAVAGVPLTVVKAFMKVDTPASAAARKGGKTVFHKV